MRSDCVEQRIARLGRVGQIVRGDGQQQPEVWLALDDAARYGGNSCDVGAVTRTRRIATLDERDTARDECNHERGTDADEQGAQSPIRAYLGVLRPFLLGGARFEELAGQRR
jgi:hypothetical protein